MNDTAEFQRESHRIDQQIWDALALGPGERALFLGFANEGAWVARAVEIGVTATVLAASVEHAARAEELGAIVMRASATMIPAADDAYDVAVAMHYLHEIDPGFHAHVVSELARVARRVAIVEPSPPTDPLGKRIAALYARAKRENGQFESYQPIEYWRRLLAVVKAEVSQTLLTFQRIPPRAAVTETVSLILDAMAIEEMPQDYLEELRALAARPDAQLLPLSRIVLVGAPSGAAASPGAGTPFRVGTAPAPSPPRPASPLAPAHIAPVPDTPIWPVTPPAAPAAAAAPPAPPPGALAAPPPAVAPARVPPPPPPPAAAPPPGAPFGTPFALPDEPSGSDTPFGTPPPQQPHTGFGWSWEPPELDDTPPER